jgi:hypothetical protein
VAVSAAATALTTVAPRARHPPAAAFRAQARLHFPPPAARTCGLPPQRRRPPRAAWCIFRGRTPSRVPWPCHRDAGTTRTLPWRARPTGGPSIQPTTAAERRRLGAGGDLLAGHAAHPAATPRPATATAHGRDNALLGVQSRNAGVSVSKGQPRHVRKHGAAERSKRLRPPRARAGIVLTTLRRKVRASTEHSIG